MENDNLAGSQVMVEELGAGMNVWVAGYGILIVSDEEIAEAGIEFRGDPEKATPKLNFDVMHDFICLYVRDEVTEIRDRSLRAIARTFVG